jgi:hypothetical protein
MTKKYSESTLHVLSGGYLGNNCAGCSKKNTCTKQINDCQDEDEEPEPMIPPGAEEWKKPQEQRFQPDRQYADENNEVEPMMVPNN